MESLHRLVVLFLLIFMNISLYSQKVLTGYIVDEQKEPLCASTIIMKHDKLIFASADVNGYFSLPISEKSYSDTLIISFLGFKKKEIAINKLQLDKEHIFVLVQNPKSLSEIIVYANQNLLEEFSIQKMEKLDIYMSPMASGDPLKAINMLPISTNVDENAEVELRGSSGDKSVVSLNNVPINKPVKNSQINGIGSFSLFNPEIIQSLNIYPSNPPLTYGNALAGIVDIQTNDKLERDNIIASLSLANAGIMINQKISTNNFVQAYGNIQFSNPYIKLNKDSYSYISYFKTKDFGLNLHFDFNKKLHFNIFNYYISEEYKADGYLYNYKAETFAKKKRWFQIMNLSYNWSKSTILTWNSGVDISKTDYTFSIIKSEQQDKYYYNSIDLKSQIKKMRLQLGTSHSISNYITNETLPLLYYSLRPGAPKYRNETDTLNHNLEIYLLGKLNIGKKFIGSIGLRKNVPLAHQKNYLSYQSSLRYNINNKNSLLLGMGHYNSYRVPTFYQSNFNHQSSNQGSLSFRFDDPNNFNLMLASYYKSEKTSNWLSERTENIDMINKIWGLELYLEKYLKHLVLTGSYTYLNSKIKYKGNSYNSLNKLDYIVRLSARYQSPQLWGGGLSYTMRPGLYFTPIDSSVHNSFFDTYIPIYGLTNSQKEKLYSSLDFSLTKMIIYNKTRITLFASINNLLNRENRDFRIYSSDYNNIEGYWYYQKRSYYMGCQISF